MEKNNQFNQLEFVDLKQELSADKLEILYLFIKWCASNHSHKAIRRLSAYGIKHLLQYNDYISYVNNKTKEVINVDARNLLNLDFGLFYVTYPQMVQAMIDCNVCHTEPTTRYPNIRFTGGFYHEETH